jgi:signal transduction histidine kinase
VVAAWREALELWDTYDPRAWEAWQAVIRRSDTEQGREARARVARANSHFTRGIAEIERRGSAERAATELADGADVAPMDPRLYLRVARGCERSRWYRCARNFYRRFIETVPHLVDPALRRQLPRAERSLAEVEAVLIAEEAFQPRPDAGPDEPPDAGPPDSGPPLVVAAVPAPPPPAPIDREDPGPSATTLAASAAALTFALVAIVVVISTLRRRGVPLARLAADSPELHPAIAYLVGCLRHELLKHRVGAVGDAVGAFARGDASPAQRKFLLSRLYQGEPLSSAWQGHMLAFERALGTRVDLRRDRAFRDAARALGSIEALEDRMARGDAAAAKRLLRAHQRLRAFDRELAALVTGLVRTTLDRALLDQVVDEVRGEYSAGSVLLDDLRIDDPPPGVAVEVFRVDLVLILKNLVRNALLAVGRAAPPRMVSIGVRLDVEPTGEEIARIRVQDTSPEKITTDVIHERGVGAGLGLVTVALARYDGAIEVEPGDAGYSKSVTVRFFRALDEEPAHAQAA